MRGAWRGRLLQPTKSSDKSSFLKFPYYQKKIHWLLTIILVINTKQVIFCTKAYLSSIHNQKYRRKGGQNYENTFFTLLLYIPSRILKRFFSEKKSSCVIFHISQPCSLLFPNAVGLYVKIERCSQI